MKYNTSALIAAIDTETQRRTEAAEAANTKAQDEYYAAKAEWLASENPKTLRLAAGRVVRKVDAGGVIVYSDLGAFSRGFHNSYHFRGTEQEPVKPNLGRLESLRAFLLMVTDDEVTTAGLRDAGFRNIAQTVFGLIA